MGRGKVTDAILMKIVQDSPGLSLYQLKRRTGWNVGKVDGSVRRLVNARKTFIVADERNGRRLNLVYPNELKPNTTIIVPSRLLHAGNPAWARTAHVYALDHHTIGIAGGSLPQWRKIARFMSKVPIKRDGSNLRLKVPREFEEFYHLDSHYFTKTINANNILLSVGGQLVEFKSYPS
jgi:hypothetical protein